MECPFTRARRNVVGFPRDSLFRCREFHRAIAEAQQPMHIEIEPPILYFGTPVVLISSTNPDGSANLAPMSSAWALGWSVVLGLGRSGQTFANLDRTHECVLNFPSADMWRAVERLAPLTGRYPVPDPKLAYGGRFEPFKFEAAGLHETASVHVKPPRVAECPLQVEARVNAIHLVGNDATVACVEVRVLKVHAEEQLLSSNGRHIVPERWSPLIYNFRHYFGLGPELGRSFRSTIPNEAPAAD